MAVVTIALGQASVLFTFYPPLTASPWFYIGLVLVVAGSWVWCILMLVAMRVGLVILIDVTSFPALNPFYLAPAYFLLVSAAVLSCAAWLEVSYGAALPSGDNLAHP